MEFRRLDPSDEDLTRKTTELVDSVFGKFFKAPQWEWKYHDPHSEQHMLSYIALDGDEVVAAIHYQRTALQIDGRAMSVLVGGDLIVRPDHRGKGLTTPLTEFARTSMPDDWRGGATFMFTRPRLGAHYRGFLGYSRVPAAAEQLTRIRSWSKRIEEAAASDRFRDAQAGAAGAGTSVIEWRMEGAPTLWSMIEGGEAVLRESHDGPVDATVSGRMISVQRLAKKQGRYRALAGSLRRRELQVSGSPVSIVRLARSAGIHIDVVRSVL